LNPGIGIAVPAVIKCKLLLSTPTDGEEQGYTSVVRSAISLNAEEAKVFWAIMGGNEDGSCAISMFTALEGLE